MAPEQSNIEQAVSRALRDSLTTVQRNAEELQQAVADLAASCSSSRPSNALPPMLRAQTAAASLAAVLDVLSRFVASSLHPVHRAVVEEAVTRAVSVPMPEPVPAPVVPPPAVPVPMAGPVPAPAIERVPEPVAAAPVVEPPVEVPPPPAVPARVEEPPEAPPAVAEAPVVAPPPEAPPEAPAFDIRNLPANQQELHRKASRHAKVSMQDIKLIRPEQVRLGRENRDLCLRLREDIDKARKEYDRRFRPILDHPVDYFYDWMVQILADGDAEKLGKYPYPSPAQRR